MMALLALGIYVAGLVLAFGWRTHRHRRATGDGGLRLHAGRPGTLPWWAKVSFIAALGLGLAGPLAAMAGLPPLAAVDEPALRVLGLAAAGVGIAGTLAAQAAMGASWRVGVDRAERTQLVTGGAFAVCRNPVFTAMITTSVGLALLVPNAVSVLATVALLASVELQVRGVEEPYLQATHGRRYVRYAGRVGRFLPGLGRLRCGPSPSGVTR